ncbi:MAG: hypothetical protein PVH19_06855 [Planctomycetia bacterium]|jgi:hypothetical protein
MKSFLPVFVGVCLVSFGTVFAEPIVVASHTVPPKISGWFSSGAGIGTDDDIEYDNREAQTFTATADGWLKDVSFIASKITPTNVDLRVSVTLVVDGRPGKKIGTLLMDKDLFPNEDTFKSKLDKFNGVANFGPQQIPLKTGSQYAIVFSTDTVEANYRFYGDRSGYDGGTKMSAQNDRPYRLPERDSDFFFQVTVTSNPAPKPPAPVAVSQNTPNCPCQKQFGICKGRKNRIIIRLLHTPGHRCRCLNPCPRIRPIKSMRCRVH